MGLRTSCIDTSATRRDISSARWCENAHYKQIHEQRRIQNSNATRAAPAQAGSISARIDGPSQYSVNGSTARSRVVSIGNVDARAGAEAPFTGKRTRKGNGRDARSQSAAVPASTCARRARHTRPRSHAVEVRFGKLRLATVEAQRMSDLGSTGAVCSPGRRKTMEQTNS